VAKLCVLMQVRQWYDHERYGGKRENVMVVLDTLVEPANRMIMLYLLLNCGK